MRFRRRSREAQDIEQPNNGYAGLPPLPADHQDRTSTFERPALDSSLTTTTIAAGGLRAPRPEDLIAPAVWDDDVDEVTTHDDLTPHGGITTYGEVATHEVSPDDDTSEVASVAVPTTSIETADDTDQTLRPEKRGNARRWRLEDWGAVLIMAALSLVVVDRQVAAYPTLSSPTEVQHIDYAYKASRLEIPRPGDALSPMVKNEAVCRGIEAISPPVEDCEEDDILGSNIVGDYDWEAGARSIPYYFVTGMLARFGQSVGLFDNFTDGARWVGAIWLLLAWSIVWYTMLSLGVERRRRAAIVSVFIATPLVIIPATIVGSSASLFFVGALVLLATVKYATGSWSWWTTALVFAVGYVFEPSSAPFEIVYLLFIATLAWRRTSHRARGLLFPVAAIGVLGALWGGVGEWISQQIWPVIPRPVIGGGAAEPNASEVADIVSSNLLPINHTFYPPFMDNALTRLVLNISSWLVSILVGSVALFGRSSGRITVLARWVLVGVIVVGPLVAWQLANRYGLATPFTTQLVLPFVAALVVIGGTALVTRSATVLTALVGIAVIANEIRLLFFL